MIIQCKHYIAFGPQSSVFASNKGEEQPSDQRLCESLIIMYHT